ncbi:MAG: helix-turn-helix domain-containing protein [Gemmatimonadales bacterium]|nr:helix-turn-helix domain-containing protein [Gemmatimonadales bacterium]
MDISEVARQSGVAPSALRFYEERGLIQSTGRRGLRRQYDDGVVEQLALITLGRAAGLSLSEIGGMLTAGGRPRVDRGVLAARAKACDEQIRKLTTIRDGLRHAAACPAEDHLACPKFRRLMGLAAFRAAGKSSQRARRGRRISSNRTGPPPKGRG